jgi:PKD repeat protein
MKKLTLVAIAISMATLSGCNESDESLEITSRVTDEVSVGTTALRNMSVDSGNTVTSPDSVDSPPAESVDKLTDGNYSSKFLSFSSNASVIINAQKPYPLKGYVLVSGNDAPERDPQSWILSASNDGDTWTEIDSHTGQVFSGRGMSNTYDLAANETEYQHYRFSFSNEGAADIFQLAEVELMVKADKPLVAFSTNKARAEIGEAVQFWDQSLANPTSWKWTFKDGTPATSTTKNPSVTFDALGTKNVTLVASNDKGENTLTLEQIVTIWDSENPWAGYEKPGVTFSKLNPEHPGQLAFERVVPDMEQVIHDISLAVAKILYHDVTEIPLFKTVTFETGLYDFPAAKGGTDQDMILYMDLNHLATVANNGDQALRDEVLGMLWHELTHGYNNSPNSGEYAPGNEYHSYLEGLADYVRIKAGYNEHKRGGIKWIDSWNEDAYNQTSFFLEWVANSHRNTDFIYLFNKAAGELEQWSFDAGFKAVFGEERGIDVVFGEYQEYLKSQGITPPIPTPVEGYSNFAIKDGVIVSTTATHIGIWGEGPENLVDNNINNKFNAVIEEPWWIPEYAPELSPINVVENIVVTIEVNEATLLNKYSLTTGNDNDGRDPTSWTVLGSLDGENWTELDTAQSPQVRNRLSTYHYDIDGASTAYNIYQFVFENAQQGDGIGGDNGRLVQIGELALLTLND